MVKHRLIGHELYVEIGEEVLNTIYEEALRAYPFEGGGFLFGAYTEDRSLAQILLMVKSPSTHASGSSFLRSVSEKQFMRIHKETGLHYLGEWHSHPDGNAQYSGIDRQAMIEIAEYNKTEIENPLLMIVSVKSRKVKGYEIYMYDNKQLLRYEQDRS